MYGDLPFEAASIRRTCGQLLSQKVGVSGTRYLIGPFQGGWADGDRRSGCSGGGLIREAYCLPEPPVPEVPSAGGFPRLARCRGVPPSAPPPSAWRGRRASSGRTSSSAWPSG